MSSLSVPAVLVTHFPLILVFLLYCEVHTWLKKLKFQVLFLNQLKSLLHSSKPYKIKKPIGSVEILYQKILTHVSNWSFVCDEMINNRYFFCNFITVQLHFLNVLYCLHSVLWYVKEYMEKVYKINSFDSKCNFCNILLSSIPLIVI